MAIPKSLKPISEGKALSIINRSLKAGKGDWEGQPMASDFVYGDFPKYTLIRPGISSGEWETGRVSL